MSGILVTLEDDVLKKRKWCRKDLVTEVNILPDLADSLEGREATLSGSWWPGREERGTFCNLSTISL